MVRVGWQNREYDATSRQTAKSAICQHSAPAVSLVLKTGAAISVPGSLSPQMPAPSGATAKADEVSDSSFSIAPPVVLHPVYLEAADAATAQTNPNRSVLIAPDADKSYLLPDQSAVLYQKSGATYVVSLTRIKNSAFVQLQKEVTLENARSLKNVLFTYERSGSSTFPTKMQLAELVKKQRAANGDGEALLRTFVYTPPPVPLRDIDAPETVIIGYILAPKGRAIIYANESVKWVDKWVDNP